MLRRGLLRRVGVALSIASAGCVGSQSPGSTESPTDSRGTTVSITSRAEQPDAPIQYEAEMAEPLATDEHPARLRVTIQNPTDEQVVIGEERAVKFHHVSSTNQELYLHPTGGDPPVEDGCWQLTEPVAVAEYYGTISLDAGASVTGESYVYGHPALPADTCLPTGEHQITTTGQAGTDEDAVLGGESASQFEWGLRLRIE